MFGYNCSPEVASSRMCGASYATQAESAKAEIDKFDAALAGILALPYIDMDYKTGQAFVGALYLARQRAQTEFERNIKCAEEAMQKGQD